MTDGGADTGRTERTSLVAFSNTYRRLCGLPSLGLGVREQSPQSNQTPPASRSLSDSASSEPDSLSSLLLLISIDTGRNDTETSDVLKLVISSITLDLPQSQYKRVGGGRCLITPLPILRVNSGDYSLLSRYLSDVDTNQQLVSATVESDSRSVKTETDHGDSVETDGGEDQSTVVVEHEEVRPGDPLPCARSDILEVKQLSILSSDKILDLWYISETDQSGDDVDCGEGVETDGGHESEHYLDEAGDLLETAIAKEDNEWTREAIAELRADLARLQGFDVHEEADR